MRQSALALIMATVARAYASSSCTICSSSGSEVLFAASRQEANSGLGKDNRMSCHAGTSGDPSGDIGVLGRRDPIAGPEQIGHIIAIVQDGQVGLGISTELTTFCQPVYSRSNVLDRCVLARGTSQKIGRKPPPCGLSWGTNSPKFQLVPLNVTNSGYLTPNSV